MKTYRSHKTVTAAKIVRLDWIAGGAILHLDGADQVVVDRDWLNKRLPPQTHAVGGYYVAYSDGHTSWSPPETFEAGYTEIPPGQGEDEEHIKPEFSSWDKDLEPAVANGECDLDTGSMNENNMLAIASVAVSAKRTADALTRIADVLTGTQQTCGLIEHLFKEWDRRSDSLLPF